jgi:diaminopimelate decarboxylase
VNLNEARKVGGVEPLAVVESAQAFGTPHYLYDQRAILDQCRRVVSMPRAFGLDVHFAMKANSSRAVLQLVTRSGIGVDASSVNEVRRAKMAGVQVDQIMLTTQEVPEGDDRRELEAWMSEGLVYNACSLLQLELIADFAAKSGAGISLRVNPGSGAGESVTRNTGDNYSSFGIHRAHLARAVKLAKDRGVRVDQVHSHIGSGGDPARWRENIDRMLAIVEGFFPDAKIVNLGGGFKVARMPDETPADIEALGSYAEGRFREFAARTGRQLDMAVEPGTFIMANSGYLVTRVIDKKSSGSDGFEFLVLDAGMDASTRPLLYGSRHPFYVVTRVGRLLSSEFDPELSRFGSRVVVGRCCESGDSQTLDLQGHVVPRAMADPDLGDYVVIGGLGAYAASMSLINYNSYVQAPEVLLEQGESLRLIRGRQSLDQIVANEFGLEN